MKEKIETDEFYKGYNLTVMIVISNYIAFNIN